MAEYINREELLKDIEDSVRFSTRNGVSAELRGAHKITDCIRSAPAADVVEVVHGEWIITHDFDDNYEAMRPLGRVVRCSVCGYPTGHVKTKFCPNCGAKMDEKGD